MSRQPHSFELELAVHAKRFLEARDQATKLSIVREHPKLLTQNFFDRPGQHGGEFKSLLHVAVKTGNIEDVKLLLANGANPDIEVYSCTPIHYAKNLEMVKVLHESRAHIHHMSATGKNVFHSYGLSNDAIDYFIEHGVDVKLVSTDGSSALHFAAISGNDYLVSALIKAGAPVDAIDGSRNTALHYAVSNNNPNIAYLLVKAGASTTAKNLWRETPLECCDKYECEIDVFNPRAKMPREEKPQVKEAILKALHELAAHASTASAEDSTAGYHEGGAASSAAASAIPDEDACASVSCTGALPEDAA